MPGRNAKPIELHVIQGNPNRLTKAQIETRKKSQIRFGKSKLTPPDYITRNNVAFEKWQEIAALYKGQAFIAAGDVSIIARYCQTHSEYLDLLGHREKIGEVHFTPQEEEIIQDEFEDVKGKKAAQFMWEKVDYLLSISGLFALDKAINAKLAALQAMEDRLFLNPLSKVKNVPKKEDEKPKLSILEKSGFGNV